MCLGSGTANSPVEVNMTSALIKGCFHFTVIVRGSGASTPETNLKPGWLRSAVEVSMPTWVVKSRSSEVNGAPSCQTAPWRIRQVVSIDPSPFTFQSPFSRLGTASARSGTRTLLSFIVARPEVYSSSISVTPRADPDPDVLMVRLSVRGTSRMAVVIFRGPVDRGVSGAWLDVVVDVPWLGPEQAMTNVAMRPS